MMHTFIKLTKYISDIINKVALTVQQREACLIWASVKLSSTKHMLFVSFYISLHCQSPVPFLNPVKAHAMIVNSSNVI